MGANQTLVILYDVWAPLWAITLPATCPPCHPLHPAILSCLGDVQHAVIASCAHYLYGVHHGRVVAFCTGQTGADVSSQRVWKAEI